MNISTQSKQMVTKSSGERVVFSEEKLRRSLERSGAGEEDVREILNAVRDLFYPNISTKEIYKKAFKCLKKKNNCIAARYNLKRALQQFGPTGYPFEKYIAKLFEYQGYDVLVGKILQGHCVTHELDIIATKNNKYIVGECKFHAKRGYKCGVKTPLYIHSRYRDLLRQWQNQPSHKDKKHECWIMTNARFSEDALTYANCAGLRLLGWSYPKRGSLKERIDISGLYPVTCLTTLTSAEKKVLLEQGCVLAHTLLTTNYLKNILRISEKRISKITKEIKGLCLNQQKYQIQ